MRLKRTFVAAAVVVFACHMEYSDRASPGNQAGGEAVLEYGEVAVDDVTETVFVMRRAKAPDTCRWDCYYDELEAGRPSRLFAVTAEGDSAVEAADLTGLVDIRMAFPRDGLLILGERYAGPTSEGDELRLLDRTTFAEVGRRLAPHLRFYNPVVSPSGRWVLAVEGDPTNGRPAVVDAASLDSFDLPSEGVVLAQWAHGSDRIVVSLVQDLSCWIGCSVGADPRLRVLSWSMDDLAAAGFARDGAGLWVGASLDLSIPLELTDSTMFAGPSLAVSPDDALVAVAFHSSVYDDDGLHPKLAFLALVDLATGSAKRVDGIASVTGFSADGGATVIGTALATPHPDPESLDWPYQPALVDRSTLAVDLVEMPDASFTSAFAPRSGRYLVLSARLEPLDVYPRTSRLFVYDLELRRLIDVAGPPVGLWQYVERPGWNDLWLCNGTLARLDFAAGEVHTVPLESSPTSINYLPRHDRIVLVDRDSARIVFVDPVTEFETRSVAIPPVPRAVR